MMNAYAYFQRSNGNVERVAEVDIPEWMDTHQALEHVYCLLQNIRGSWSFGPFFEGCNDEAREGQPNLDYITNVKFLGEHVVDEEGRKYGERSMMIGDLITYAGKTYEVAMFGFEEYVEEAS